MDLPHWRFYLAIMEDLNTITRYIEPCPDNYSAYSLELSRILLAVGSEIDVVAKQICTKVAPEAKADSITEYCAVLTKAYPQMVAVEVTMERHSLSFVPWQSWGQGESPSWWKSYNDVKHHRHERFSKANLENTLNATAGLCVLVVYLYHETFEKQHVSQRPLLFVGRKYDAGGRMLYGPTYRMPDFPKPTT